MSNELDALLRNLEEIKNISLEPERPPSPKNYEVPIQSKKRERIKEHGFKSTLSIPNKPQHPPKLEHALLENRTHDLIQASKHEESIFVELQNDVDDIDGGETPRGDKSMIIKTEIGDLKSKYHYLGFGLWENTEPEAPHLRPRALSPPPPIWYNCTVSHEHHSNSKELDDLVAQESPKILSQDSEDERDGKKEKNIVLGDLWENFQKEGNSDMFSRVFQEKLTGGTETEKRSETYCFVCSGRIEGRIMTALTHKFHPECFVCTYCKKQFQNRSFKTDFEENKPYCYECFEKLLGYFGTVRTYA